MQEVVLLYNGLDVLTRKILDSRGAIPSKTVADAKVYEANYYGWWVVLLLKLVKEVKTEVQDNAANTIGLLGRDLESVEHMVHDEVCSVFIKVLKEGPMKVQVVF
nr:armadillo-type fold protein [Tanacetum cinerariifolium]